MSGVSARIKAADAAFAPVRDFYLTSRYGNRRGDSAICDLTFGNPHEMPLDKFVAALREKAVPQDKNWFAYKTSEDEPQAFIAERLGRELSLPFAPADVALTAFGPARSPRVSVVRATPEPSVFEVVAESVPPPAVTAQFTVTLSTGLLYWSWIWTVATAEHWPACRVCAPVVKARWFAAAGVMVSVWLAGVKPAVDAVTALVPVAKVRFCPTFARPDSHVSPQGYIRSSSPRNARVHWAIVGSLFPAHAA